MVKHDELYLPSGGSDRSATLMGFAVLSEPEIENALRGRPIPGADRPAILKGFATGQLIIRTPPLKDFFGGSESELFLSFYYSKFVAAKVY